MKILIWVAIASTLLIVGFVTAMVFRSNHGTVTLINRSTESIAKGSMEVCGQKFNFTEIHPGESETAKFAVRADSHYQISITFRSGREISKQIGYVTSGFNYKDRLVVTQDDILLEAERTD